VLILFKRQTDILKVEIEIRYLTKQPIEESSKNRGQGLAPEEGLAARMPVTRMIMTRFSQQIKETITYSTTANGNNLLTRLLTFSQPCLQTAATFVYFA